MWDLRGGTTLLADLQESKSTASFQHGPLGVTLLGKLCPSTCTGCSGQRGRHSEANAPTAQAQGAGNRQGADVTRAAHFWGTGASSPLHVGTGGSLAAPAYTAWPRAPQVTKTLHGRTVTGKVKDDASNVFSFAMRTCVSGQ